MISFNQFLLNIIRKYFDNYLELLLIILQHCNRMVYPLIIQVKTIFIIHPFIHISYVNLFNLLESCSQ